jgi:hypothetical protein
MEDSLMSAGTTFEADSRDRRWRISALAGTGVALLLALIRSGSVTEQDLGFAFWILVAWLVAMAIVFRTGRRALIARPELLVPVGIVVPISVLVDWLAAAPRLERIMQPIASVSLWGLGFALSISSALNIALWTMFAAWQTDLLIRAQASPNPVDLAPWTPIRRCLWPAFGALAIGAGGLQVLSMPLVKMFSGGPIEGFTFCLLLVTLVWNVLTFALLPWIIQSPEPFAAAIKSGIRQSWRQKWRWSPLAILQLLLLGAMTYYSYSGYGSSSWSFNVHNPWVGGYECRTNWYVDHQEWLKLPSSPFAETLLMLAFLVLAVAVKISVIKTLLAKPEAVLTDSTVAKAEGKTAVPVDPIS